ncbi:hypothetical protein RB213_001719 [Colletotrichum asianum]
MSEARLKLRLRLPARHRITAISPSSPLCERVDIKTWGSLAGPPPVIISQGHDRLTKSQAPHHSRLYRHAAPINAHQRLFRRDSPGEQPQRRKDWQRDINQSPPIVLRQGKKSSAVQCSRARRPSWILTGHGSAADPASSNQKPSRPGDKTPPPSLRAARDIFGARYPLPGGTYREKKEQAWPSLPAPTTLFSSGEDFKDGIEGEGKRPQPSPTPTPVPIEG